MLTIRTVVACHWSSTVVTESVTTPATSPVRPLSKQTITNNNKNQQQQQQTIKNRETLDVVVNLKNTTSDVSMVSTPCPCGGVST